MPVNKLKDYLDEQNVKYIVILHSQAFTAQEIAASAHIPGKEFAKTVILKMDNKMAMAVLPSSYKIDLEKCKEALGATSVQLAMEEEFKYLFPECEIGAMPPFGNLYNMETFVAESLINNKEIAFNAGNHQELIKVAFEDFMRLVKPKVIKLV